MNFVERHYANITALQYIIIIISVFQTNYNLKNVIIRKTNNNSTRLSLLQWIKYFKMEKQEEKGMNDKIYY